MNTYKGDSKMQKKLTREMAKDEVREKEALEWSEGLIGDINNEKR